MGRLSHGDITEKIFGSAQMHRRFGYKMSSGLWHKKDGYCGRKVGLVLQLFFILFTRFKDDFTPIWHNAQLKELELNMFRRMLIVGNS